MAQINKVKLPNGTTYDIVPSASDITVKSKLYFEAVNEDNVTYKKLVAEYVAPDPEDIDTAGTLTVYSLNGNAIFTMDMNNHRFDFLSVVNMLTAGTLRTSDVVKPSGSTWDGTNTSLTTAISLLNSTLAGINIASVRRIVKTVITGATGNIATGIPNDGKQFVIAPLASGYNTFFRVWVSSANNGWYLKAIDPETGKSINNTQMAIRYLLVTLKES